MDSGRGLRKVFTARNAANSSMQFIWRCFSFRDHGPQVQASWEDASQQVWEDDSQQVREVSDPSHSTPASGPPTRRAPAWPALTAGMDSRMNVRLAPKHGRRFFGSSCKIVGWVELPGRQNSSSPGMTPLLQWEETVTSEEHALLFWAFVPSRMGVGASFLGITLSSLGLVFPGWALSLFSQGVFYVSQSFKQKS